MSEWNELKNEDIEISIKDSEVNLHVSFNDFGNIYCVLTFEQVTDIYNKIMELKE